MAYLRRILGSMFVSGRDDVFSNNLGILDAQSSTCSNTFVNLVDDRYIGIVRPQCVGTCILAASAKCGAPYLRSDIAFF